MKWMSRNEAQGAIELEMGRPIIIDGFDQREVGTDIDVVVVHYSFIDDSARAVGGRSVVRYRLQVFVNGERSCGTEVGATGGESRG